MSIHCDLCLVKSVSAQGRKRLSKLQRLRHHACGAHVEGVEAYLGWDKCPYCQQLEP